MHLYFWSRGVKHQRDLFVTMMQGLMFLWKRINLKTGKEETTAVQGSLRPLELWEYVFPEESLNEVLTMLDFQPTSEMPAMKVAMMRKMLGAKKIPKIPLQQKTKFVHRNGVCLYPIGIKKDERRDCDWSEIGQGKYNQEVL